MYGAQVCRKDLRFFYLSRINEIIISPYLDYIEKNIGDKKIYRYLDHFTMSELGGYCVDNILDEKDPDRDARDETKNFSR